jgi:hypothetical protein
VGCSCKSQSYGARGEKNPGWLNISAASSLDFRCQTPSAPVSPDGQNTVGAVIPSQKSGSLATRSCGELPAMIAALIAPIDMPATQSGGYSEAASVS